MQGRLSNKENYPLQSFPYGTWENEFNRANKIGFKNIEWLVDKENDKNNPLYSKKGIERIKKIKKQNEINIETLCAHFIINGGILKTNYESRKIKNYFLEIMKFASSIGIKYVSMPLMDKISLKNKDVKNEIEIFLHEIINESEVDILIETDIPNLETFSFAKKFKSNKVGIVYDTGNATKNNFSFKDDFPKIYSLVKEIHLKDFSRKLNQSVTLGFGDTNFIEIFKTIKHCKWNGFLILETPIFKDYEKEAKSNLNYIFKLYSKYFL